MTQLPLDDVEREPSCASSTAWAWRSWWGANRQRKVGQTMAENRVKLGLAGAVLLVTGGGLAALAARSGGDRFGADE
jgi:hypothetical protein